MLVAGIYKYNGIMLQYWILSYITDKAFDFLSKICY